jgi:cytochrome c553
MWDIQSGTRNGASAQLMKLVVANLSKDDMVSIAAYVSSRVPPPHAPTAAATQTVAQR